jgi:hypothetical protein
MSLRRTPGTTGLVCTAESVGEEEGVVHDERTQECYVRPGLDVHADRGPTIPPADTGPELFPVTGDVPLPSPLTPEALVRVYLNLPICYREPGTGSVRTTTAAARIYTNLAIPDRTPNLAEKDRLLSLVRAQGRRGLPASRRIVETPPAAHSLAIAYSFFGKGLPSHIATAMSYAITLGRTTPEGLRTYCDDLEIGGIGLDCSGFVNAFFMLTRSNWRERHLLSFRNTRTQRRTSDSIEPEDVLVWESADASASNHIAIVSRRTAPGQFIVAESSGSMGGPNAAGRAGGVGISTYTIPDAAASGVITVTRGNGRTSTVKVFGVPRTT